MKLKYMLTIVLVVGLALAACAAPAAPAAPESGDDVAPADITIDVLTFTGPQIAEPLQRRGQSLPKPPASTSMSPWCRLAISTRRS